MEKVKNVEKNKNEVQIIKIKKGSDVVLINKEDIARWEEIGYTEVKDD